MNYDIAVIIGRFQPIHRGHIPAFRKAEEIARQTVCVIGSINKPSTPKNPFSFEQRAALVEEAVTEEGLRLPYTVGVEDTFYREQEWYRNVRFELEGTIKDVLESKANMYRKELDSCLSIIENANIQSPWDTFISIHGTGEPLVREILHYRKLLKEVETCRIAIVGFEKDASSYYVHNFADWDFVEVTDTTNGKPLGASKIRELWFEDEVYYAKSALHNFTYEYLTEHFERNDFLDLQEDYWAVKEYKQDTQVGKYPVQFLTTDAVVIHGDEVLLIRRGCAPGKGQWALPGGFVNHNEKFFDSCVRELREETRIDVPEKVIRGSKKDEKMFDFPGRSSRGRTVSMVYLFVLDPTRPRPRVKGGDDAVMAHWFSLSEVEKMGDQMYEDHRDMIEYMTARI